MCNETRSRQNHVLNRQQAIQIIEYIQRVKIEAAKKGFEISRKNISEGMYEVGYTDTKGFRTISKKVTGLSHVSALARYIVVSTHQQLLLRVYLILTFDYHYLLPDDY